APMPLLDETLPPCCLCACREGHQMTEAIATCHCGAVTLRLAAAPETVTRCNCSLCRRYGVLWAYHPIADVTIEATAPTDTYAWNGQNVDFHRCATCGCVTHWVPRART